MQAELKLAISEIQDLLKKRQFKAALFKLERMLDSCQLQYSSPMLLIDYLLLQVSTINKLLERNLLKKYKYEVKVVEELIDLLKRNLSEVHYLISSMVEERGGTTIGRADVKVEVLFPLVREPETLNQIKLQKLEFKKKKDRDELSSYLESFVKMINISLVNAVQTFSLYKREINWRDIEGWLQMTEMPFSSLSGKLSQIKCQLLFAKFLTLQGRECLLRAQGILEAAIDQLLCCLQMVNMKAHKVEGNDRKSKKYAQRQKECYKLLMIALVATNKNNMKLGREEVATLGCDFIRSAILNLGHGYNFFKRMLQPQLYLFQQFLRYRIEKQQLMGLTLLYFPELPQKLQAAKQQVTLNLRSKQSECEAQKQQKLMRPSNQKTIIEDISTVKTISAMIKQKGNSSLLTTPGLRNTSNNSLYNSINNSKQMGDTLLTNMIIGHIQRQNQEFLAVKKKIGNQSYYKKMKIRQKNVSMTQRSLKKQKLGQQSGKENENNMKSKIYEIKNRRDSQQAIQRLERKARINLYNNFIEEEERVTPITCQFERELENGKQFCSLRHSGDNSFEREDIDYQQQLVNIGKKTKLFVEILFHNRGGLGIRKIVQKFQLLKKREEQKQKMNSNRVTTSVNKDRDRGQVYRNNKKFKVIAEELLRTHIDNFTIHQESHQSLHTQEERKKHIQANYVLGQDSIEAIKSKLIGKMERKERQTDKSQLKEQVFKQKLKRLGSTNFFIKRAENKSEQPTLRINSQCDHPSNRISQKKNDLF